MNGGREFAQIASDARGSPHRSIRPARHRIPRRQQTGKSACKKMVHARHLHALLVATNLFWFQAIRQTVATLAVSMGQELGYSTKEKGWLIAAPSVGNIVTQLFGSHLERAIGARMTITLAVSGLAAGCLLVPVACSTSLSSGLLVLAAQGFVFGPMFPAHSVLLSRWTLPSERGWASAQGELAISIASMGAPLLVASLATAAGWRVGFYSVGTLCVLYVIFGWLRFGFSSPRECPYVSEAERALLSPSGTGDSVPAEKESKGSRSGAMDSSAGSAAPMHHVLLHPSILALFSCHMVYNLTTLSINSWMPSYYAEVRRDARSIGTPAQPPRSTRNRAVRPPQRRLCGRRCSNCRRTLRSST